MTTVNLIATPPSASLVTNIQSTTRQTVISSDSQPLGNSSSSVTISPSGMAYFTYEQQITQSKEAQNQSVATAFSDPKWGADLAYGLAHDNSMAGEPVGGLLAPGTRATDPATYASGAPVTVASQAYFTKQNTSYQNQVLELFNTEKAKGTAPGKIVSDIYTLQAKQPAAFRAMMMWSPASDLSSIQAATNLPGTSPQYLYANGQIVNS